MESRHYEHQASITAVQPSQTARGKTIFKSNFKHRFRLNTQKQSRTNRNEVKRTRKKIRFTCLRYQKQKDQTFVIVFVFAFINVRFDLRHEMRWKLSQFQYSAKCTLDQQIISVLAPVNPSQIQKTAIPAITIAKANHQ